MNVVQILNSKGSSSVESIAGSATLSEAAKTLARKKIGALVVSEGQGRIDGIVSERDIVRKVAEDGPAALETKVSAAMTAKVVICAPDESALSVLERMTQGRFRHMPVVEDGTMIGLLSIGDVVKARIREIEAENEAMSEMLSG